MAAIRTSIISICLLLLINCSVDRNRKLLNFFFDGVPEKQIEKNIVLKKNTAKILKKANKQEWVKMQSKHRDYFTRKCDNCHDRTSNTMFKTEKKDLCYLCHKKENFDDKFIHGPVAVGQCLACHEPHQSKYKKLLKVDGNRLCLNCHNQPQKQKYQISCKRENRCNSCHLPHVADNRFLIAKK